MDVAAVGRQFGLNEEQTRAALDALVPVVAAGVRRTAQSPEGLQEIFKQVLTSSHGGVLEDADAVSLDRAKPGGDEVLGQIFGKKQVSREVAQQLSATSGVGAAILKQLLPIVATMVLGTLAKKMGSGGAVAGEQVPQSGSAGGGETRRHLERRAGRRRPGRTATGSAAAAHAGTRARTGRVAGRYSRRHIEWRPGAGDHEADSTRSNGRNPARHLRRQSARWRRWWRESSATAPAIRRGRHPWQDYAGRHSRPRHQQRRRRRRPAQLGREDSARSVTGF